MAPRIVVVGGGSYQWVPKLLIDVVNTESLREAEIVLEDVDPAPLPDMVAFVEHLAALARIPLTVTATTDQREALSGADYVVVTISTGGFDSMRHDLAIPERYGIRQAVGDTVGPGGVMRALRNIPVLLGIARDMAELCPDAWLLNLTNPMTTLCRAVTRETPVKAVGLCHEVAGAQHTLSRLLRADYDAFELTVAGVNHLPIVTELRVDGVDAFERLRALLDDPPADERVRLRLAANRVKFALFERYGVLPGAGDRHLVEFFPGFLTEQSGWGERWGVALTTIADREAWLDYYKAEFENLRAATEVPKEHSGEMVAPIIDSFETGTSRVLPLNLPNAGQCPDLPVDVVVEAMCAVDRDPPRGRTPVTLPPVLAEWVRRIVGSQEATVEAAVTGDRDRVVDAMLLDPFAGRIDFDSLVRMTDDMLAATSRWLPQFA